MQSETVLVNTSCENEFISIALGENVMLESFTNDKFCEELSHLFVWVSNKEKSAALTIEIF